MIIMLKVMDMTQEEKEIIMWNLVREYGYDDEEIANLMEIDLDYIKLLRELYQKKNMISEKKYILIKEQGKRKKEFYDKKYGFITKNEDEKDLKIEKFLRIKETYQKEYNDDILTFKTMRRYFRLFDEVASLGNYKFTKEDIDILSYIVMYEEKYFTDSNIKYVIKKYLSIGQYQEAMRFLNNCINYDKKLISADIIEMKKEINKYPKQK